MAPGAVLTLSSNIKIWMDRAQEPQQLVKPLARERGGSPLLTLLNKNCVPAQEGEMVLL